LSERDGLPERWVRTTLEDVLPIQYGKGLTEKNRDPSGKHPVYGSSGVIGVHRQALTSTETLVLGRKGSVGSVHYSPLPCWPIDTTYYAEANDNCES
jgi:type I restriction enzyme, S subunit